ncbi:MAG: universal stress protein [Anaerolineales bacterium]|nr:universal stress protein [Anaerolineales bacterium]MCA9928253.1 universal stress protein [Anaerolineales bacterium]
MAHVSHKLSNSLEGALAGGGDPATSPLYVFGPFLKLIVVAGVAQVTFGASVWLAVLTIAMVSAMYRLVMRWVVDGSGGSGLSEDEFGSWAVKINAGITFTEYTLTFLVSMAALVTFIADRFPLLNETFLGFQYRTFVAIILSVLTGWLVNRGPKMAARAFGPATAAILLLLWTMVIATLWQRGLQLPAIKLDAFRPEFIGFTFGGYARILAVMTGIEIFANLVAAYDGSPTEKSRKAFYSLLIIMGTTAVTMLVVGPAILDLSNPINPEVSVFTQTMDRLLPAPLPWLGTLVGVSVLLSASAASAQGLQNLAVGLKYRNYVPAFIGRQNQFDVAAMPVWIEVGLVTICFLFFGTNEETYLAIYAAGVFILLSMTGWAAAKRLLRELRSKSSWEKVMSLGGTAVAATLTTGATIIIFAERFREGAWTYFIFIPMLYAIFTYFRNRLGTPTLMEERLGLLQAERRYLPVYRDTASYPHLTTLNRLLVPLDGSGLAEESLSVAQSIGMTFGSEILLLTVSPHNLHSDHQQWTDTEQYLQQISMQLGTSGARASFQVTGGGVVESINGIAANGVDLIVMSTNGRSGLQRMIVGSVTNKIMQTTSKPILMLKPTQDWRSRGTGFKRLLVALDGSEYSERVLPYVRLLAQHFGSEVILLTVPEGLASESYQFQIRNYLLNVADELRQDGIQATVQVTGNGPARTIVRVSEEEMADLIMLATHGRGGVDRLMLGSVADRVSQHMPCPVFLVPIREV